MNQSKDSKTEKASPHRRLEARKKGNVFQSKDLISGIMIFMTFLALRFLVGYMFGRFESLINDFVSLGGSTAELTELAAARIMFDLAFNVFMLAGPILAVAMILGIVVSVSQTRFIFTTEQLKPKLSKLNPIEGFKKMFSLKSLVELVKSMLKITVIASIVYIVLTTKMGELPGLVMADIQKDAAWMLLTVFDVAIFAGVGMIAIGILDFIYQWWEHERSLMMSKQEIKDEYKQLEGDPLIKSRIRSIREKRARERMMSAVKEADVVIRNPEHYAVALKYEIEVNAAPLVIAKGQDNIAMRIITEADKYNIMTVENPPLARVIYNSTEIGAEIGDNIPEELMIALTEIILRFYESKNRLGDISKFAGRRRPAR
ncbi:MAG: flagellar biosynthesis protein FlhB [Oscillospiraceae bacterium]|nr:flagellar biosynthesis protein FlhB [Oscillospiraceae bacterium]